MLQLLSASLRTSMADLLLTFRDHWQVGQIVLPPEPRAYIDHHEAKRRARARNYKSPVKRKYGIARGH